MQISLTLYLLCAGIIIAPSLMAWHGERARRHSSQFQLPIGITLGPKTFMKVYPYFHVHQGLRLPGFWDQKNMYCETSLHEASKICAKFV